MENPDLTLGDNSILPALVPVSSAVGVLMRFSMLIQNIPDPVMHLQSWLLFQDALLSMFLVFCYSISSNSQDFVAIVLTSFLTPFLLTGLTADRWWVLVTFATWAILVIFRKSLPDINKFLMEGTGGRVCLLLFPGLWRHRILTLCSKHVLCKTVQPLLCFLHLITFWGFFLVGKYHLIELVSFKSIFFSCAICYVFPPFPFRGWNNLFCFIIWSLNHSSHFLLVTLFVTLGASLSIHSDATDVYISASYVFPYIQMQLIIHLSQLCLSIHLDATDHTSQPADRGNLFPSILTWDPFEICPARSFCSSPL